MQGGPLVGLSSRNVPCATFFNVLSTTAFEPMPRSQRCNQRGCPSTACDTAVVLRIGSMCDTVFLQTSDSAAARPVTRARAPGRRQEVCACRAAIRVSIRPPRVPAALGEAPRPLWRASTAHAVLKRCVWANARMGDRPKSTAIAGARPPAPPSSKPVPAPRVQRAPLGSHDRYLCIALVSGRDVGSGGVRNAVLSRRRPPGMFPGRFAALALRSDRKASTRSPCCSYRDLEWWTAPCGFGNA